MPYASLNVARMFTDLSNYMMKEHGDLIHDIGVIDSKAGVLKDIYYIPDAKTYKVICSDINDIMVPKLVDVTGVMPCGDTNGPFYAHPELAAVLYRMAADNVIMYWNYIHRPAGMTCSIDRYGIKDLSDWSGHHVAGSVDNKNEKSARTMGMTLAEYHALLESKYKLKLIMPEDEPWHLRFIGWLACGR